MSFVSDLFIRKNLSKPIRFNNLITDMHSHLITGMDDGVKSLEEAVSLIRQFSELGFSKLITTPHIQKAYHKNTPEKISCGYEKLKKAVEHANIPIEIEVAAEYLIDEGFEDKLKNDKLLTFGNKYVLIELSYITESPHFSSLIFELQIAGYNVVLAHPERYSYWHQKYHKITALFDRNVFLQLNTISLSGYYGEEIKKTAEKMVNDKLIRFLGSDIHNINQMRSLHESTYLKFLDKAMETNPLLNHTL